MKRAALTLLVSFTAACPAPSPAGEGEGEGEGSASSSWVDFLSSAAAPSVDVSAPVVDDAGIYVVEAASGRCTLHRIGLDGREQWHFDVRGPLSSCQVSSGQSGSAAVAVSSVSTSDAPFIVGDAEVAVAARTTLVSVISPSGARKTSFPVTDLLDAMAGTPSGFVTLERSIADQLLHFRVRDLDGNITSDVTYGSLFADSRIVVDGEGFDFALGGLGSLLVDLPTAPGTTFSVKATGEAAPVLFIHTNASGREDGGFALVGANFPTPFVNSVSATPSGFVACGFAEQAIAIEPLAATPYVAPSATAASNQGFIVTSPLGLAAPQLAEPSGVGSIFDCASSGEHLFAVDTALDITVFDAAALTPVATKPILAGAVSSFARGLAFSDDALWLTATFPAKSRIVSVDKTVPGPPGALVPSLLKIEQNPSGAP